MSRILDAKKFQWTPSWRTDITVTLRKNGFKRTPASQRARPAPVVKMPAVRAAEDAAS